MALFSFRHSVKTFSEKRVDESRAAKVGQTAAHLRYIARPKAARVVLRERLTGPTDAATAQEAEVAAQRGKGRVCERFIIALPVEATAEQREAMVRAFAEQLTGGSAGYMAAIHDKHGNDQRNPHFHLVAFDVMIKSGGRGRPKSTLGMARKHAVETSAKMWADTHNELMWEWGFGPASMISHLSLKDRGIDRIPTIHEGVGARAMARSKKEIAQKGKWRAIDEGHSRAEANRTIRQINQMKEMIDEREYRLGRSNEENHEQLNCLGAESRAYVGWGGKVAGTATPSGATVGRRRKSYQIADDPSITATHPRPIQRKRPRRPNPSFFLSRTGRRRRSLRRRYRVRRIFRELDWLRATLKARLLKLEARTRLRPPEIAPVDKQLKFTLKLEGTER
ncbi:MobA/MobL family protein [Sulfitobacter pontiacus]|uniref:MobA/MobL family protein n=1 Tax=Sulfitobacter pontiacus TaxID=60137 RepID=UPI0032654766